MSDYKTIVVAYDFSEHSRAALYTACDLARRLDSHLHLVHVVELPTFSHAYGTYGGATLPPPTDILRMREAAANALREVAAEVQDLPGKLETHVVEGGGIADAVCEAAGQLGADLIVMGTHGRTGLAHVFLGSVAERTLRKAGCPVLAVRSPEEDEAGSGGAEPRP